MLLRWVAFVLHCYLFLSLAAVEVEVSLPWNVGKKAVV
jgi:hypothetical protein